MKGPLSLFSVFRLCETTLASIALVIPMRIMANDYANQRAPEIDLPPGRPREDSPIPPSQTRIRLSRRIHPRRSTPALSRSRNPSINRSMSSIPSRIRS